MHEDHQYAKEHQAHLDKSFETHLQSEDMAAMFADADADSSGAISRAEFLAAYSVKPKELPEHSEGHSNEPIGQTANTEEGEAAFALLDRNGDGVGDFKEATRYFQGIVEEHRAAYLDHVHREL